MGVNSNRCPAYVFYLASVAVIALLIAIWPVCLTAQTRAWQPSPGHAQIPIWPATPPDARPVTGPETYSLVNKPLVGDRPWHAIAHVSRPTMTVYSPTDKNTGTAIVVFPGGGYWILAIDLEGTEVCDWLTSRGITCVLLKYRVPGNGFPRSGPYPESPIALEDAQRTVGLVRFHAALWHIDPHKIGVLGFSAGGSLVADISNRYSHRLYSAVDAADKVSCRPDFAIALYPGHLSLGAAEWDAAHSLGHIVVPAPPNADKALTLNPFIHVTSHTPPTFLLQAEDDHVDNVNDSLSYYIALKNAGVPAEMHLYAHGGHAFGLRPTQSPITHWPQLVDTWLTAIGMTAPSH